MATSESVLPKPLPRDREVLTRLYSSVSDQLKRWDEAREVYRAAFTQMIGGINDGRPEKQLWKSALNAIAGKSIHISSDIEAFAPTDIEIILAKIGEWIGCTWLNDSIPHDSTPDQVAAILTQRRLTQWLRIDRQFKSLLTSGKALQSRILEGMDVSSGSNGATTETPRRKHNRKPAGKSPNKLTSKQLEACALFGETEGNMAEVARRMGVKRPTAQQHYDAANKKMGISAMERAKTKRLNSSDGVKVPKVHDAGID